jgi:putative ABC transport system ATP-binding protein
MTVVSTPQAAISCQGVWKVFKAGRRIVEALVNVSFDVQEGEFVCIRGPSGSGKSTLLNLLGALDLSTRGSIVAFGRSYESLTNQERGTFRRTKIGFVFQELTLVPHLTALENVALPLLFDGIPRSRLNEIASKLLGDVELAERMDHLPAELSYGERQRVAVARAVIRRPALLLIDEPTANLDAMNVNKVCRIFERLKEEEGTTIVAATHDARLEESADRVLGLVQGRLVSTCES